ncbi:hypothetical protein B296_00047020, partial [Ensete ventricosum]
MKPGGGEYAVPEMNKAVRPRVARYVPVQQLTGTWTDRYRAVPVKLTVGSRFRPSGSIEGEIDRRRSIEEEKGKKKRKRRKKKYLVPSSLACPRRPWAILSPHGERDQGD